MNNADGISGMSGMSLLSFVWSFINVGINCQFSQLLLYLLRSLCETYFAQLQRWLYHGELDEPFNELFINSCSHKLMHERSKEFFDKAYYVRSDAVPGFLMGYEQAILQCGKYNRFLKNYNSQVSRHNVLIELIEEQIRCPLACSIQFKISQLSCLPVGAAVDENAPRIGTALRSNTAEYQAIQYARHLRGANRK